MNICIIGDSLTTLALAKNLINKKIKVFLYYKYKKKPSLKSRTIGISKNNLNFFNKEIVKFKKDTIWNIKKIEIYNEKLENEKILNFEKSDKQLFSIIKNDEIYKLLDDDLKKFLLKIINFMKKF